MDKNDTSISHLIQQGNSTQHNGCTTRHSAPPTMDYQSSNIMDPECGPSNTGPSWQIASYSKKRKLDDRSPQTTPPTSPQFTHSNRYAPLATSTPNECAVGETDTRQKQPKIPKPPPIFVQGVANYQQMVDSITHILENEQYTTKCMAGNDIKINVHSPDTYRKLVRHFHENKVTFHTYQIKQERAYRVVIRHLHPTIPTNLIIEELALHNHKIRNIINIKHRTTKEPLPLFFIDLEPADNNKDIYNLNYLLNLKISVEPPRKSSQLVQCTRCQNYNHTKSYCNRPYACVKCGGQHKTTSCAKTSNTPATCALCDGPHPANYKGCKVYQDLQEKMRRRTQQFTKEDPSHKLDNHHFQSLSPSDFNQKAPRPTYAHVVQSLSPSEVNQKAPRPTYADVAANKLQPTHDLTLTQFLDEFKQLFNQLLQQNSMILNMLTTVISKLVN